MAASRHGYTEEQVAEVVAMLRSMGFGDVRGERRELERETVTAILARR